MDQFRTLQELWSRLGSYGETAAIIAYSGGVPEVWSFTKLAEVSARAANGLTELGVARADRVALVAPNSPIWIAGFWAIVTAGAIAVPLDPQSKDEDLVRMLETAGCHWLFTTTAAARRIAPLAPGCQIVIIDADESETGHHSWVRLLGASRAGGFPPAASDGDAVIVFTSGTTGAPKAVPLTHANLLTNITALAATGLVGLGDRALLPLPLYHAYPLTIGMLTPLALGCGVILPGGISGPELVEALRSGKATALLGVPRLYAALCDNIRRTMATWPRVLARLVSALIAVAGWTKRRGVSWPARVMLRPLRNTLSPGLRLFVSGGAPIKREVEEMLSAMGWELLTGYGLVETASMLTFNPPGAAVLGSAGRPVPGMELRIVDQADGIGEIEARGPALFAGYCGDPVKTREAFTADGWFRTGDLGSLDDRGYLHIAARKAETIVLADGKKLFPEEFESVYATVPLVREVALLEQNGALVALVIPDLDAAREFGALRMQETIRDELAAKGRLLPSYARPTGYVIAHEALPRTQLGKIRRHLLPPIYAAAQRHIPSGAGEALSAEDAAWLQRPTVAKLWLWLKQRFPDQELRLDTIPQIDLGIDSLGWVELTLALERDFGIVMKESEIAQIVSLRDLLRQAASAHRATDSALPAAARTPWLEQLPPWLAVLRRIGEVVVRSVMRRGFELRVEGVALLPSFEPVLLCPNHVSYLDPFALGAALASARLARTCWGGWTGVAFTSHLRRLFSRAARVIPVDPDRGVASSLAMGRATLEKNWNLVWFPEGARSPDGQLQHFQPGVGALVTMHPVPVIPVYIDGTFAAWPVGRKLPRRRPITVRFGKALEPETLLHTSAGLSREEAIASTIRDAVASLATRVSSRVKAAEPD